MFIDNSRYVNVKTVETKTEERAHGHGASCCAGCLTSAGTPTVVQGNDRLDVMAQRKYGDPTKFWHIADANTELEANKLVKQRPQDKETRTINVPEK